MTTSDKWTWVRWGVVGAVLVTASVASAEGDGGVKVTPPAPVPTVAECHALGGVLKPTPFSPGETLDFDIDALGAKAGDMVMRVLPAKPDGTWPIEVTVASNTFFSKVRKVRGTATSSVEPKTLRPQRYHEDTTENDLRRIADVRFASAEHVATLQSTVDGKTATTRLGWGNDISDVASAVFLLRGLPLKEGQQVCFDAYGIRRIWRVWGTVLPREHVSLPLGEFDAWHLAGQAARLDLPDARREIHVWVSDDARRLPLAALGTIDLGAVRATLKGFTRPDKATARAENKGNLKW